MEKLVALARRRGFLFQSSELYGGLNGAWDYGPLGVELKRNVKDAWWKAMVRDREDVVGIDGAILMHPMVWKASGHVSNFADPMVDCKKCKKRYRVDEVEPEYETTGKVPTQCPDPKCKGELTPARKFNLMFETHVGPLADSAAKTYLRPETAQGIFANFKNVVELDAHQGAVRHRADRQVVPQRDQPAQLHVPLARVRADGDGVLLQARQRRQVVRVLGRGAQEVVRVARHQDGQAAFPRARKGEAFALLEGDDRRRVSVSRSAGASSRASPIAPTSICARIRSACAPSASGRARSCRTSSSSKRTPSGRRAS